MGARLNVGGGKEHAPVFCTFLVWKVRPAWHALAPAERTAAAAEIEQVLARGPARRRGLYSLVGFRPDADLMLWAAAHDVEDLQRLAAELAHPAGAARSSADLFETTGVYVALAKPSPYTGAHVPAFLRGVPPQRFVIMYPFVKTHEWYRLPFEERRRMMEEHGRIGGQWPQVFTNTLYAFGLGDYEFVVAFETAAPADFLALVERLREAEVRRYTLRDTPIFLAARKPFWDAFADLGTPRDRATLLLWERPETVAALAEGRQVVVLRRGGTKENAFGAPGDTVLIAAAGEGQVALAARVAAVFDVTEAQHVEALRPFHPLVEADARDRFLWRGPAQPLRALVLRAMTMPPSAVPPEGERFGEWTELPLGLPITGARPVLAEDAFTAELARVREALRAEVVEA